MSAAHQKDITKWASKDGQYKRMPSSLRNTISADSEHKPEKGRYQLYVSYACPWACRTLIVRALKGLEEFIDVSVVHPHMGALGWSFYPPIRGENGEYPATKGKIGEEDGIEGTVRDPLHDSKFLRELYFRNDKDYGGRFTVPLLWDKKLDKAVNNESSDIVRIFNTAFNKDLPKKFAELDFYPDNLKSEIDEQNEWVYNNISNGVYMSGFATTQKAYERNVLPLFESLDRMEKILEGGKDFCVGNQLTEADVRLYTTMVRFDPVYVGHFKCNIGTIRSNYPNINRWMKNFYWNYEAFKAATNFEHIKLHYYTSHPHINPSRVVPAGPTPHIEDL